MLIFKTAAYTTYVFKGLSARNSFLASMAIFMWGLGSVTIAQTFDVSATYKPIIAVAIGVSGNFVIVFARSLFT